MKILKKIFGSNKSQWNLQSPAKRGGSYSIYFGEKHIANVRGKTKAFVLIDALHGKDSTDNLIQ